MGYVKMSIVKVREYFREFRMENRILEFPVSSATVQLAAEALHCEPARIAKTLSLMQSLYETHKLLTYPRTDSRYITKDVAAVEIIA